MLKEQVFQKSQIVLILIPVVVMLISQSEDQTHPSTELTTPLTGHDKSESQLIIILVSLSI